MSKLSESEAGALLLAYRDHEHGLEVILEKLKGTPYYQLLKKSKKKKTAGKVKDGGVEKKKFKSRRSKTPKGADKKPFFNYDSE